MARIPYEEMKRVFEQVLLRKGLSADRAKNIAEILAGNSLDGVASHGVNRFVAFVDRIRQGRIDANAQAERVASMGAWEQWDGHHAPGPLNAMACTERAMELASVHGMGCVGLRNTNHWMRAGAYGWRAATAGYAFLCWTNTIPNMPAWGALDARLGNNPLVLAVPRQSGPVVLDMAMTQFSYGRLSTASSRGEALPVPGGYDAEGEISRDPEAVAAARRPLPIGYWKGAGLALLLDLLAALVSGGLTTREIGVQGEEYEISQVFVAIDVKQSPRAAAVAAAVEETIADLHASKPMVPGVEILYPGERALRARQENLARGIPVDEGIWKEIVALWDA